VPFPINSGGRRNEGPPGAPSPPPVAAPVAAWTTNADGLSMVGPGFALVATDQSTGAIERRFWQLTDDGAVVIDAVSGGLTYTYELPAASVNDFTLRLEVSNRAAFGQDSIEITVPMPAVAETAPPTIEVTSQTVLPGVALLAEVTVGIDDAGLERYATSMVVDWGDGQQTTVFSGTPSENFWPLAGDDLLVVFAQPLSHTYTTPGIYTIRVDSVSIHGVESASTTVTFTVAPDLQLATIEGPPIYATAGSYHPVGLTVSFNGTGSCTSISVNWGDGVSETITRAASTTSAEFSHQYVIPSAAETGIVSPGRTIIVTAAGPGGVDTEQRAIMLPPAPPAPSGVSVQLSILSSSYIDGVKVLATFGASGLISARTVAWGDGSVQALPDGVLTAEHTYPSKVIPQDVTITFTASGPGGSTSATAILNWPQPASPLISASFVEVSRTVSLITYAVTYASTGGPVSAMTIDYDDGAGAVPLALPATGGSTFTKSYLHQDDTHTITIAATGPTGLTGVTVLTISTAASATTIGITSAAIAPSAGSFLATVSFAATNATSATIDWDDGSGPQAVLLGTSSATKLYAAIPSGVRSVVVAAANSITGQTASAAIDLTVPAQSPVLTASMQSTAYDGTDTTATIVFTSTGEISQQSINWGDGTTWTSPTNITAGPSTAETLSHTYSGSTTDTNYTVTLTVTGLAGTTPAVQTFTVLVQAVTPPSGTSFVKLQAYNGAINTALDGHPVGCLVSFAQAENILTFQTFRVFAAGADGAPSTQVLAAQYKVLSRWHALRTTATAPVKNLWVTFVAPTLPAANNIDDAGTAVYWLQLDAAAGAVNAAGAVSVSDDTRTGVFTVSQPGQPTYTISKTLPSLLHAASLSNGDTVVQSAGSALFEYADNVGTRTFTVSSTVLEEGTISPGTNVKAVIRQTGLINDGSTMPLRYTARWTFLQGIPDVDFSFTVRNPRRPHGYSASAYAIGGANQPETAVYVSNLSIGLKMPSTATAHHQLISGSAVTTALTGGQHYRVQQTFRERYYTGTANINYTGLFGAVTAKYDLGYSDGHVTTEHMLSVSHGVEGSSPTVLNEMYPGAVHANGASGGITVAMESFAHRAPKAFRLSADGTVRAGMFPNDFPGGAVHRRSGDLRPAGVSDIANTSLSALTNANRRPAGNNPASGVPWRTNDIPTQKFPDGTFGSADAPEGEAKPVAAGTVIGQLSPLGIWRWQVVGTAPAAWYVTNTGTGASTPIGQCDPLSQLYYPLYGGRQVTMRLRLRATAAATSSLRNYAEVTNNPPIALSDPARLRTTRGPTVVSWVERGSADYATETLSPEPDLRRSERWVSALGSDAAADPTTSTQIGTIASASPAVVRYGMPTHIAICGVDLAKSPSRSVGWDIFGNFRYGGQYSNHHYDVLLHTLLPLLRYRSTSVYAFYRQAKILQAWDRDMAAPLTDDSAYVFTGITFDESCFPHGQSTNPPIRMSHNFRAGLALSYVLFNDELAHEALRYSARPLLARRVECSPVAFNGANGNRIFGWALRAAAAIYHVLGPLAAPVGAATSDGTVAVGYTTAATPGSFSANEFPAAGTDLLREMLAALQRWDALQAGTAFYSTTSIPTNFIPSYMTSGAADTTWPVAPTTVTYNGISGRNYSNNGVILRGSAGPPTSFGTITPEYCSFSPFMETICFVAMAETLRTLDGVQALPVASSMPAWTLTQISDRIATTLLILHRIRQIIRNQALVVGTAQTAGITGNTTLSGKTYPLVFGTPVVDGAGATVLGTAGLPFIRQRWAPLDCIRGYIAQAVAAPTNGGLVGSTGALNLNGASASTSSIFGDSAGFGTWLFAEAYLTFSEFAAKTRPDGAGLFVDYRTSGGQQHDLTLMKYFHRCVVRYSYANTFSVKDTAAPPATVYTAAGDPIPGVVLNGSAANALFGVDLTKIGKQMWESFAMGLSSAPAAYYAAGEIVNR